ncbi:hypothetical protein HaLaN_15642 [Haematococcus lacustris]|uniref:ANK_REP_REGION domain-containing protein n=1 Tax=Haematococcus lacustris TaxID=44745 RepID=A0A699ZIZ9_HAELA|nr:hypothetical protein HaLaN_15642 [Haematococcus lacustris]
MTALHLACRAGHLSVVAAVLAVPGGAAAVDLQDSKGLTVTPGPDVAEAHLLADEDDPLLAPGQVGRSPYARRVRFTGPRNRNFKAQSKTLSGRSDGKAAKAGQKAEVAAAAASQSCCTVC